MRKVFSMAFIAILSLIVVFYSCQKPQDIVPQQTNTTIKQVRNSALPKEIVAVGYVHNSCLEMAFNTSNNSNGFSYKDHINGLSKSIDVLNSYEGYHDSKNILNNIQTKMDAKSALAELKLTASQNVINKKFLDDISLILNNSNNSAEYDIALNEYYLGQVSNYSGSDLVKFNNMCGVASGSYEYWNNNIEIWEQMLSAKHIRLSKKEKVALFVLSDLTGWGCVPLMVIASGLQAYSWD